MRGSRGWRSVTEGAGVDAEMYRADGRGPHESADARLSKLHQREREREREREKERERGMHFSCTADVAQLLSAAPHKPSNREEIVHFRVLE